jgi:hypothetical protein
VTPAGLTALAALAALAACLTDGRGRPARDAPVGNARPGVSDARRKTAFRDVDGEALLGKLAALPVRTWQYRSQGAAVRHMGPTAQDFRAAFAIGESDTAITAVDADGVALAAAQALERRTRALQAENAALRAELAASRQMAAALRRDVTALWSEIAAGGRRGVPR